MVLSNDVRGWIMTAISGVACVLGASIICADVIVCRFPGMKGFRIQNSDSFLSASLSLSFGVMLFSSTYKMLPSAKRSLEAGDLSKKEAAWVLIICFIVGAIGIQILSRILHHYIPSHVVNCEHTHEEADHKEHEHGRSSSHGSKHRRARKESSAEEDVWPATQADVEAQSSLVSDASSRPAQEEEMTESRPSLQRRVTRTLSKLSLAPKDDCDADDNTACHGFTETCGQECFKIVQSRGSVPSSLKSKKSFRRPGLHGAYSEARRTETTPLLSHIRESSLSAESLAALARANGPATSQSSNDIDRLKSRTHSHGSSHHRHESHASSEDHDDHAAQHHHHVPNNAFLSIGLQTSIAIALHKLPEGFITYATNHANPQLGFSVFMALFIHNITEGFALALPLYLAIQSRWRAMVWAFVLGGCSQPLGAGIAALWFHIAGNSNMAPGERVYGAMFAVTAGIMTSVALQLFSESLDLTHNRNLCMMSAFAGMGIMGISSALTA